MSRIGFDAKRLFNNFTGLGNYSRTLLRNLVGYYPEEEYFLYTPKAKEHPETNFFLNSPMFTVRQPNRYQKVFWRSSRIKGALGKDKIQLYHGLSHEIPLGIDASKIATIVTIHDLIFKHYPEQYGYLDRQVYDFKFKYACEHADAIIAISESTKQDIIKFYQIPAERIHVIYQSCSELFMQDKSDETIQRVLAKYKLPTDFLLYVGSLIERKNLLNIVKAMAQLPKETRLPLVIVGRGDAYKEKVIRKAKALGVDDLLIFLVPAYAELPFLYQQAKVFLYPSYFEGFGIPIIESLFSKTPVITSNLSSLPEAAGPTSVMIDPSNVAEISNAIEHLLTDDNFREKAIDQGWNYVQRFRGEPVTEQLMQLYQQFLD